MAVNLNQIAITGNLTDDPKLVELPSGHILCELQLANSRRVRDEITGEWEVWPHYFTVKSIGFQARTCHEYLCKGHGVAISGCLSSRRVLGPDRPPRHIVEIIAESVQFLTRPEGR